MADYGDPCPPSPPLGALMITRGGIYPGSNKLFPSRGQQEGIIFPSRPFDHPADVAWPPPPGYYGERTKKGKVFSSYSSSSEHPAWAEGYRRMSMAPVQAQEAVPAGTIGPHPSHIQVAKSYIFEQEILSQLAAVNSTPQRDAEYRINGIQTIHDVRTFMGLPAQTYTCASIYYHKFRLLHKDTEYKCEDAALAALFCACKIQDTLKKSRDILCASHNMKVTPSDYLSPDDPMFEGPSRTVIGIERLMLECSGFDFRSRFPHKYVVKLAKFAKLPASVALVAFDICCDMYKTFAPLKQSSLSMAFACLELASLITGTDASAIKLAQDKFDSPDRGAVMETLLDLIELYTHHTRSTIIGPKYDVNVFIQLRISLNKESQEKYISRYRNWVDNKGSLKYQTPKTPITPASPAVPVNGRGAISPATPVDPSGRKSFGARGADGTVRFMLDAEKAKQEKAMVEEYYRIEFEEYEIEVEEPAAPPPAPRNDRPQHGGYRAQNDRPYGGYHGRRGGRR